MIDSRLCFVVMPFSKNLANVYDAIEAVVTNECGMKCVRADRIAGTHRITDDIQDNIRQARLIIADLTNINPNVFYEVGMAHGREKHVILIVQNETEVPFDLREVRYLRYDPDELASLRTRLLGFMRKAISTLPSDWNRNFRPTDWNGAYIKVTSLQAPSSIEIGQPFEIRLTARNNGNHAHQGYFSVCFPDGADDLTITSNVDMKIGQKGSSWCNGNVILSYPIAEGFLHSDKEPVWRSQKEFFITVKGYPKRKGLFWYYVNASSYDAELRDRRWDPVTPTLDVDQRGESVYCGVIEVRAI